MVNPAKCPKRSIPCAGLLNFRKTVNVQEFDDTSQSAKSPISQAALSRAVASRGPFARLSAWEKRRRAIVRRGVISVGAQTPNRLLVQAGDYAAFIFKPLPLQH